MPISLFLRYESIARLGLRREPPFLDRHELIHASSQPRPCVAYIWPHICSCDEANKQRAYRLLPFHRKIIAILRMRDGSSRVQYAPHDPNKRQPRFGKCAANLLCKFKWMARVWPLIRSANPFDIRRSYLTRVNIEEGGCVCLLAPCPWPPCATRCC
jgi:hypothetical protein